MLGLIKREIEIARSIKGKILHFVHTSPIAREYFIQPDFVLLWKRIEKNGGSIGVHCHEEELFSYGRLNDPEKLEQSVRSVTYPLRGKGLNLVSYRGGYLTFCKSIIPILEKNGIAKENRTLEKRVIIQPSEIKRIAKRHEVVIEKGAGLGIDIPDESYVKAGCRIGSREEVYNCDLVARIKEPNFEEIKMMRPGAIIMSMMHIRCQPELDEVLHKQKLIVIPLENLKDPVGRRKVDAVEDAGRIGMECGFKLWGQDPATATVKIMGYGSVAMGAIRCAARKLAKVEILNKKNFLEMEKHIPGTDILVDGIYHTSCWGWPGLEPKEIAKRYSLQVAPILRDIANKGLDKCPPRPGLLSCIRKINGCRNGGLSHM